MVGGSCENPKKSQIPVQTGSELRSISKSEQLYLVTKFHFS